jgi:hypothetical protein
MIGISEIPEIFAYSVRVAGPRAIVQGELLLAGQIAEISFAGLGAIAAGFVPVMAMELVFVALGAPYLQAREIVRKEETQSGFSQGFVMGILDWKWEHLSTLFYRHGVIRIYQADEELNNIRVKNYDTGLFAGYVRGHGLSGDAKHAYVSGLRKLAGHPTSGSWTRNDQISFVISLAVILRQRLN